MLDTLMIVLATLPTTRPNMERSIHIKAPTPAQLVLHAPDDVWGGTMLTTCYENNQGSCWSEN